MSDTFTEFLKRGIGPRPGMQRIPFPTESYIHPSKPLSSKHLVNLFIEQEPTDARTEHALLSTPGLVVTPNVFGTGPVKAMNADQPGVIYVVSGSHFYRLTAPLGVTLIEDLGSIGIPTGTDFAYNLMPTIAVGVSACVVCVPPNAFTCTHAALSTLNQITTTFPADGARSVAYVDGYFVFTSALFSSQFFICHLLDPTMFNALDFAFADGLPNILRRVMTVNGELWFIGDAGIEVWYDSGDGPGSTLDFPFRKRAGGVIPYGAASMKSCIVCDGSLFWVSASGIVFRSNGYRAVRVSTHAVEAIIRALGTASFAWALSHVQDGHTFYCVTMGPRTLAYDCATKQWADRSSSTDGSQAWFPSTSIQVGQQTIFGDSFTGRTFNPDPDGWTDDGIPVVRQMTMPPIWGGTNKNYMNRLEIEMQVGGANSPGPVTVDWSDDGGVNYRTPVRTMSAGTTLQTKKRVFTTRMGSFHQRVLRVTTFGKTTFYAVDADITNLLAGG